MKGKALLAMLFVSSLVLFSFGCGDATTNAPANNGNTARTTGNANTSTATTPAANTEVAKTDSADPNTGVAECDDYIKKYEACLTKIAKQAPQAEAGLKSAFEAQRTSFKAAAANPQAKATLASTCKQAIETAKASTKMYDCDW